MKLDDGSGRHRGEVGAGEDVGDETGIQAGMGIVIGSGDRRRRRWQSERRTRLRQKLKCCDL